MAQFTEVLTELPESIQRLLKELVERLSPSRIILFGSRARGDHRENSDFDIALEGSFSEEMWTRFVVDLEEKNLSLYSVDLVKLSELGEDYKKNIAVEGKLIYG